MSLDRIIQQLTQFDLLPTATHTATANGTGVDITTLEGIAAVILDSTLGGGTAPTLDVKLQDSDDDGVADAYADIAGAAFTQVDDTAGGSRQVIKINTSEVKKWVRIVLTITGSAGQTFTFSVNLLGVKKYN